jgi:dipeptidyl aminopeptidase/acylaminoacyl peptidase
VNSPERAFGDLDHFLELPRLSGLALSPDGNRLTTGVSGLGPKRTNFVSSLWQVSTDPEGAPARRLTWGAQSESGAVFRPDGSLLFTSARPDPDDDEEERPASLWLLPPDGGEARPFATRPGGISAVAVAADSGAVVLTSPTMSTSTGSGEDERRHKARKELKVAATLHESVPFRFWDKYWGPAEDRLFAVDPDGLRDLTGSTGPALRPGPEFTLTPDGATVIAVWQVIDAGAVLRPTLVAIDVATGARRGLLSDLQAELANPAVSADGTKLAYLAERISTPDEPVDRTLMVLHLATGATHEAAPGWDRWPTSTPVWTPDGEALLVTADDQGHGPVFRIDLDGRTVRRLTDGGNFTDLVISRDGTALYALRSTIDSPPTPVRIDPQTGAVSVLKAPCEAPALPGTLTEVQAAAEDGAVVRGWLVLPDGAGPQAPAPLLVWFHGGPLNSWNSWHWRWNPWLAAARGYAVLLADPALSTGYGRDFVRRGWSGWGAPAYGDLMAITDVTVARADIDEGRTAAMGASYGGFMANWVAGHTDRFRGIVSHAGLWDLTGFTQVTDAAFYFRQSMSPAQRVENSPDRFATEIRTPMLITHGEKDYRVPISESLALFTRLGELNVTDAIEDGAMRHRLLVFPDENHWVLKPQNSRVWYQTVFAFLAETVLGTTWQAPELLR